MTENEDDLYEYIKMYIILYADDTVILAESPTELQMSLDAMQSYCNIWKLNIHTSKTKIVIISRGKVKRYLKFNFRNSSIDVISPTLVLHLIIMESLAKLKNMFLLKPVELCFHFKKNLEC